MDKTENNGIEYIRVGDYELPALIPPESPKVGRYGRLHLKYLRTHKNGIYTGLLLSGKLNPYVEAIDREAEDLFETLVRQMARQQGVTEKLKATDQMKWVGMMNNIRACADEVVLKEVVYR